jgi:membrane-bound lytic murein transglycosylase MltF
MDTEKTANIMWKHASDSGSGLSDRASGNVITAMLLVFLFFITPAPAETGHPFEKPYFAANYLLARVNDRGAEDLDPLHKNRFIKVLVASGKTSFFIDNGHFNGFEYEFLSAYEAFINRQGSHLGNILYNRYYRNSRWIKNPHLYHAIDAFPGVFKFMKLYGEQYQLNPLLLLAVAYKESKFDQANTSPKGAVGIMQLMPGTAADPNVDIQNIHALENNIHAGVKYLHHLKTQYFDHHAIAREDRLFLTLAAYNAGPDRIMKMRRITRENGGNPDKWFFNVEKTAAQMIGKEVVEYVAEVYKYFIAYQLQADLIKKPKTPLQSVYNR